MASDFDLIITTDYPSRTAELRLLDLDGSQLAFRQTDFKAIPVSHQHGLFDLRNYVHHYVEPTQDAAGVAEIGVCVAEDVLGSEIFRRLWESEAQRTLRIQLPGATEEHNYLAAALARIPWEIARAAHDKPTLSERNLLVRVVHDTTARVTAPRDLAKDECLRVLFVFAEARGSHPLAMRMERRELQRLFEEEIYPRRRVVAGFLTHGVTRERLEAQIQENNGYHVVHWSGHGHLNLLELATPSGTSDPISGRELMDLFTKAGGFIPRMFFLSACHSGDILHVKDWNDVFAIAQGERTHAKRAPITDTKAISFEENPGYTGTAHALLQGGVPSVVAMRYAVGDDYARDLGIEFYRALLAHSKPKTTAAALAMARNSLLDPKKNPSDCYAACDHATPLLYGEEDSGLTLHEGRSPSLQIRNRRLNQIADLTTAAHEHFVGRTWELTALGANFIGSARGTGVKPVALITGLGGMGKTALAAEALALWESRFDWVLLYQFKPSAIGFEVMLRDVHLKLNAELGHYHEHVKKHPADAIYRIADTEFTGAHRLERLTRNLIHALRDEAILLVLDNFETNCKPHADPGTTNLLWACQDPAWDYCLTLLTTELVGTPSRILITCRRPLAALAKVSCSCVLGTLPAGEAALYLREHPGLSKMIFGSDLAERTLALRLLNASRFHPLLMDRLARLTMSANLRPQLLQTLDALENTKGFSQLPTLFAGSPGDATELAYLQDAFATSVEQLIRASSRDARRLLWVIAIANEPVALELLQSVWADLDRRTELIPLVRQLVAFGLVTEDRVGLVDASPDLICHELVREQICVWMNEHPKERGELSETSIWLAFAKRLEALFKDLQHRDMTSANQVGGRALIHYIQAGAYDRFDGLANNVITSTEDKRVLVSLLPHLEHAANSSTEQPVQWRCLCHLANALTISGSPDLSLPLYEKAESQARAATATKNELGRQALAELGWIRGGWANALRMVGDLPGSKRKLRDSQEAQKEAGAPALETLMKELEGLRLDIATDLTGASTEVALERVEAGVAQIQAWWDLQRSGNLVAEAPDLEILTRALITARNIAVPAHTAKNGFEAALRHTDAALRIQQQLGRPAHDIATTRANRANVLAQIPGHLSEAKAELEDCLTVLQAYPAERAMVLSSLAQLFQKQGDFVQAVNQERRALAIREELPSPKDRATSHCNLAVHLDRLQTPSAPPESQQHQLAALIYQLVADLGQDQRASLGNYAEDFRRAEVSGTAPNVPRLPTLLADSNFQALNVWLEQKQVDVAKLQSDVDRLLSAVWQKVAAKKRSEGPTW